MKNYLDFVRTRQLNSKVLEAFSGKTAPKAKELVDKLLKKHINDLLPIAEAANLMEGDKQLKSVRYIVDAKSSNPSVFSINWDINNAKGDWDETYNTPYSISFFDNMDILWNGKANAKLVIYTMGSSIVYFLPIIWTIANSKNYNLTQDEFAKIGLNAINGSANESREYYVGALKYNIYENLSDKVIEDTYKIVTEKDWGISPELEKYRKEMYNKCIDADKHKKDSSQAKEYNKEIHKEYKEIMNAIKGGVTTVNELRVAMKQNIPYIEKLDDEDKKAEPKIRITPEEQFKLLRKYVDMVINGINPSVILCGAPGVGKTYRVRKQLTLHGYKEGVNLITIKGKCSPRVLYMTLYDYKDKGDIIVIDDADGLVGPKAPEDSINILKGALDSTSSDEGRLVTYGIAGKLVDDEGIPVPKRFYYNGGIIVITNWNSGSLDSALKGRSFMQDIDLTTDEVLHILQKLMPDLGKDTLSMQAKTKAFNYLTELAHSKAEMEISIRTFIICGKIFESCIDDTEFTDDDAKLMIKEQMSLQANKLKAKY